MDVLSVMKLMNMKLFDTEPSKQSCFLVPEGHINYPPGENIKACIAL